MDNTHFTLLWINKYTWKSKYFNWKLSLIKVKHRCGNVALERGISDLVGMFTNFVSFSLGFVSQATKHQSVLPILFHSFPIMFTLLLSAKLHQIILPITLQNFLIRSETKMVCNKIGLMIYLNLNCLNKEEHVNSGRFGL